jgi:hypothetical protein
VANGLVTLVAQELRRPGGEALARELGVENALADDDCGEAPVVGIPWPSPPTPEAFHGLALPLPKHSMASQEESCVRSNRTPKPIRWPYSCSCF